MFLPHPRHLKLTLWAWLDNYIMVNMNALPLSAVFVHWVTQARHAKSELWTQPRLHPYYGLLRLHPYYGFFFLKKLAPPFFNSLPKADYHNRHINRIQLQVSIAEGEKTPEVLSRGLQLFAHRQIVWTMHQTAAAPYTKDCEESVDCIPSSIGCVLLLYSLA